MVRSSPEQRDGRPADDGASDRARSSGWRGGSPNEVLQPQRMPPPPKRTKKRRREGLISITSGVLSFCLVLIIAAALAVSYGFHKFYAPGPLEKDKVVFIARGTSTPDIIEKLESEQVIDSGWLFSVALFLSKQKTKFGEYGFKAHASAGEVLATLTRGKPLQHSVTLPEGLTSQQIVQRLRDLNDKDDNLLLSGDVEVPAEGVLMPDTYEFARGDPRRSIVNRMKVKQQKVLDEIWKGRDENLPIRSSQELVTLASIVEKETGKAGERPGVASVFINRLNKRMKLETDPTVIYAIVGGKGKLDRPLTRADLKTPSPYNTYLNEGLPPGPIANPGRAAMEAVAHPARTRYLFFVADGTGGHAFAETFAEHQRNVQRWRQIQQDAKDKLPQPDDEPVAPPPPPSRGRRRTQAVEPIPPTMMAEYKEIGRPAREVLPDAQAKQAGRSNVGSLKIDLGPSIEARGWRIDGLELVEQSESDAAALDDPPSNGSVASYPLSPAQLADLHARQKRYAPDDAEPDRGDAVIETAAVAAPTVPCRHVATSDGHRPRAFDASEGTSLDPLRNSHFDLNSSKVVPQVRVGLMPNLGGGDRSASAGLSAARQQSCPAEGPSARQTGNGGRIPVAANTIGGQGAGDALTHAGGRRIYDASEGSRADPLRNSTFDLMSAHTVPDRPSTFEIPSDLTARLPDPPPPRAGAPASVAALEADMNFGTSPRSKGSRGFDASEGTRFDPLRDRSFDLNSAHSVPTKPVPFDVPRDLTARLPDAPQAAAVAPATRDSDADAATSIGGAPPGNVSHGFDASEGTSLDPLRDKTFDLNSPHSVPTKPIAFDRPAERGGKLATRARSAASKKDQGRGRIDVNDDSARPPTARARNSARTDGARSLPAKDNEPPPAEVVRAL